MKKFIVSILIVSVLLIGAPLAINHAAASDMSIRDFVNLLIIIGVIPTDKILAVNAFLATLDNNQPATQPSITVTSPNGGENWTVGQNHNITWNTSGFSPNDNVYISIYDSAINCATGLVGCWNTFSIAGVKNTGSYTWNTNTVTGDGGPNNPFDLVVHSGAIYKVRVSATKNNSSYEDYSNNYFSIVAPSTAEPTITSLGTNNALPGERVVVYVANIPQGLPSNQYYVNLYSTTNGTEVLPAVWSSNGSSLGFTVPNVSAGQYNLRVGYGAGALVSTNAVSFTVGTPASTPTNGVCGSADRVAVYSAPTANLCSVGSSANSAGSNPVSGTGPWNWTCSGSNGGVTAICSAPVAAAANPVITSASPISSLAGIVASLAVSNIPTGHPSSYYSVRLNSSVTGAVLNGELSADGSHLSFIVPDLPAGAYDLTVGYGTGAQLSSNSVSFTILTSSLPSADLKVNGAKDIEVRPGTPLTYTWVATDGVSASSNYTSNYVRCGSSNAWLINTLSGTLTNNNVVSSYQGCIWTVNYVVKNANGAVATSTVTISVPASTSSTGGATVLIGFDQLLNLIQALK